MEKHIEKQTLHNDISVNYTLTQLRIFFMTAQLLKEYGINRNLYYRINNLTFPVGSLSMPQSAIFKFWDLDTNEHLILNHLLLILKMYIYNTRTTSQLNIVNLLIYIKDIKDTENRSIPLELYLGKGVLKVCSKCSGEHPCRCMISIKLLCNYIEIALWHGCSPINLLHFSGQLFLRTSLEDCFCEKKLCENYAKRKKNNKKWKSVLIN